MTRITEFGSRPDSVLNNAKSVLELCQIDYFRVQTRAMSGGQKSWSESLTPIACRLGIRKTPVDTFCQYIARQDFKIVIHLGVRWYFYEIGMWRCFWTLNALSVYSWSGCSRYCWNSASSLKGIYGSSKRWKIYRLRSAIQRLPITEMYLDRCSNTSNATDLSTRNDMPNQRDPASVADLITLGSNPPEYTRLAGYFSTAWQHRVSYDTVSLCT